MQTPTQPSINDGDGTCLAADQHHGRNSVPGGNYTEGHDSSLDCIVVTDEQGNVETDVTSHEVDHTPDAPVPAVGPEFFAVAGVLDGWRVFRRSNSLSSCTDDRMGSESSSDVDFFGHLRHDFLGRPIERADDFYGRRIERADRNTRSMSLTSTVSQHESEESSATNMPPGQHRPVPPSVMEMSESTSALLSEAVGDGAGMCTRASLLCPTISPYNDADNRQLGFLADMGVTTDQTIWTDHTPTRLHPTLSRVGRIFMAFIYKQGLAGKVGTQYSIHEHNMALRWYFRTVGRPQLFFAGYYQRRFHLTGNAELILRINAIEIIEYLPRIVREDGMDGV